MLQNICRIFIAKTILTEPDTMAATCPHTTTTTKSNGGNESIKCMKSFKYAIFKKKLASNP